MLVNLLYAFLIILLFALVFLNYQRISNIKTDQEVVIKDAKKKINTLNGYLINRYEQKQKIDSKILHLIIQKLNNFEQKFSNKDLTLSNEINSLKSNIKHIMDEKNVFTEFIEEEL
jgi:hypothetical protein